jgi:hypothetical protein
VAGALAFATWVFAPGGPFVRFQMEPDGSGGWYNRALGSTVLLIERVLPVLPSKKENAYLIHRSNKS